VTAHEWGTLAFGTAFALWLVWLIVWPVLRVFARAAVALVRWLS
jgi:hypothetical protein